VEAPSGVTFLHFSAFHSLTFICQLILEHTSDETTRSSGRQIQLIFGNSVYGTVRSRDENDDTPLHVASKRGNKDIVELMVSAGADINGGSGNGIGFTALHLAIS
jgi:ankyrin repeat protein